MARCPCSIALFGACGLVVDLESGGEARLSPQGEGTDERRRPVTSCPKNFSQGDERWVALVDELLLDVGQNAMLGWPEWGEYCELARAKLIRRTQRTQIPATLHAWLPDIGPPARHAPQGRPHIPHVTLNVGEQWFTRWAALTIDKAERTAPA